jgi:hypothetical protein
VIARAAPKVRTDRSFARACVRRAATGDGTLTESAQVYDARVQADVPDDAVVIRFRPIDPQSVLNSAEKEARRTGGRWGASVFADVPRPGESQEDVIARLLVASELSGIDPKGNRKYFVCAQAKELLDRGFTFWKDEDDDELQEHYSVVLGESPSVDDAVRFLEPFGEGRRR